jgi:chemotaxis protein methyltransferase CheR
MSEKQAGGMMLTEHELSEIRAFVERRSGIVFDSSRERFFSTRVREHLEHKRIARGTDLVRLIRSSNAEYDLLLERMLTQETSFFRYPDVFEALEKRVLPEMHTQKFWENPRTLRIWSAGCSTGEEPYSIAMTVLETLEFAEAWNIHILATDISRRALEIAERGVYSRRDVAGFGPHYLENYFSRSSENPDEYQVKPRIRNMVTFAPMNLAQMVYMGRFDCIFCMNVLIYFSEELRASLIQRFADYLEPGGYLFLGHAESAAKAKVGLEPIVHGDSLIYQKVLPLTRGASAGQAQS